MQKDISAITSYRHLRGTNMSGVIGTSICDTPVTFRRSPRTMMFAIQAPRTHAGTTLRDSGSSSMGDSTESWSSLAFGRTSHARL